MSSFLCCSHTPDVFGQLRVQGELEAGASLALRSQRARSGHEIVQRGVQRLGRQGRAHVVAGQQLLGGEGPACNALPQLSHSHCHNEAAPRAHCACLLSMIAPKAILWKLGCLQR